MSKRQHGESSLSQPPEHPSITNSAPNNDNGLLPINDLLSSTDEQHPPAAHVKRPRHFIASVVLQTLCLVFSRPLFAYIVVTELSRHARTVDSRRRDAMSPGPGAACVSRWGWNVSIMTVNLPSESILLESSVYLMDFL